MKVLGICWRLMFLSLFLSGIQIVRSPVKLTPYDLAFLMCSLLCLLTLVYGKKIRLTRELITVTGIGLILLTWLLVEAVRSPDTGHAMTLMAITIRDMATMFLAATIISTVHEEQNNLARVFFSTGLLVIIIAMPVYFSSIYNPSRVVSDPRPGLIYRAGEGLFPAFQAFSHNPIYLAVLTSISLVAGLALYAGTRVTKLFKIVGLLVVLFAFFATNSRGAILAMLAGIVLLGFVIPYFPKVKPSFMAKFTSQFFASSLLVIPVLVFFQLPGYNSSVLERVIYRFKEAKWSTRAELYWWDLVPGVYEHPLAGHGLRAAVITLHGHAVENAYLDILYDQGVIGLLLWTALLAYVLAVGIKKMRTDFSILPWLYVWAVLLFAMGYISLEYDPLIWMVAGVILGWKAMGKHRHGTEPNSHVMSPQGS